jgi:hypothetical protein
MTPTPTATATATTTTTTAQMADQLDAQSREQQQRLQQAEAAAATQAQDLARLAHNVGACIKSAVTTTARLAGLPAPASAASYSYLSSLLAPIPAAAPAARPASAFVSRRRCGAGQLLSPRCSCGAPAAQAALCSWCPRPCCLRTRHRIEPRPRSPPHRECRCPPPLQDVCMAEYDSFTDALKGRAAEEGRQAGSSSPPPPVLAPRPGGRRSLSGSPSIRSSLDRQLLMGLNLGGCE